MEETYYESNQYLDLYIFVVCSDPDPSGLGIFHLWGVDNKVEAIYGENGLSDEWGISIWEAPGTMALFMAGIIINYNEGGTYVNQWFMHNGDFASWPFENWSFTSTDISCVPHNPVSEPATMLLLALD